MSANPLTKMEIDVLVQLAFHGPTEAPSWRALAEDADELGVRLWTLNVESTGDTDIPVSSYRFEMLPIGITAAEGIKHLNYYLYQTGDEEAWNNRAVGGVLFSLMRQLPVFVPRLRTLRGVGALKIWMRERAGSQRSSTRVSPKSTRTTNDCVPGGRTWACR